jgi:hypothetical protein
LQEKNTIISYHVIVNHTFKSALPPSSTNFHQVGSTLRPNRRCLRARGHQDQIRTAATRVVQNITCAKAEPRRSISRMFARVHTMWARAKNESLFKNGRLCFCNFTDLTHMSKSLKTFKITDVYWICMLVPKVHMPNYVPCTLHYEPKFLLL